MAKRNRYENQQEIDRRNQEMSLAAYEKEKNWNNASYNASHGMGKNVEKTAMDVQGHAQNQNAAATNEWNEWFKRDPDAASKAWMEYQNANNIESNPSDGVARYRNVPTKGKPYYVTNPSRLNMDSGLGDLVLQNRVMYKPDGTFDVDHSKNLQNAFDQKMASENPNNFQRLGERDYIGKGTFAKKGRRTYNTTHYNNGGTVNRYSNSGDSNVKGRLPSANGEGRRAFPLDDYWFGKYAGKGYTGKNSVNNVFTPNGADFSINGFKGNGINSYGDSFFNLMDNETNINPQMNNIGISSSLNDPYAKETNAYLKEHGNVFSPNEESPVSTGGKYVGGKEETPAGKPSIAQGKNVGYSGMSEEFDPSRTIEGAPKERLANTKDTASNIARIDAENASMYRASQDELVKLMKTDPNKAKAVAEAMGMDIEELTLGNGETVVRIRPKEWSKHLRQNSSESPKTKANYNQKIPLENAWAAAEERPVDYLKAYGRVGDSGVADAASKAGGYASESASVKNAPPQKANAMRTLDDLIQSGTLKPSTNDARTTNINGAKKVPPQDTSNGPMIYPKVDGPYTNTSSKIAGMGRLANSGANKLVQAFPVASSFAAGAATEPVLEGIEREIAKPISDAIYNNMPEELQRRLSGVPERAQYLIGLMLPESQRATYWYWCTQQKKNDEAKALAKEQAYRQAREQLYYDVQDPNYIG